MGRLQTVMHFLHLVVLIGGAFKLGDANIDDRSLEGHTRDRFKAAVYQHAVYNWLLPNITQPEALDLMNKNVDVYENQIEIAASKNVSMIVFPEYGITGFQLSYGTIVPFLEFVPNPYKECINPCVQEQFKDSPILQRLSCLARKHSMVVIANMATKIPCKKSPQDPDCPQSGIYKYNTDVALGADGELLAKYNKEHLYGEELQMFDHGKGLDNLAVFKTDYGMFGLFTCFDMLFKEPAETLMLSLGVSNMIFPTAWMNELPLLSAVEYQEAWAIRYDVNLLAANIQLPIALMTGGGLYAGKTGAVMYHYDMTDFKGTLLIGELPVRALRSPKTNTKDFKDLYNQLKYVTKDNLKTISPIILTILDHTHSSLIDSISHPSVIFQSALSNSPFTSMMNHDRYTFVPLTQDAGIASVCNASLCCHLNYTFRTSSSKREMFALGVFDGLHTNNGQYYIQTCALVKCKSSEELSCGAQTVLSNTYFQSFSLAAVGYDQSARLFPSVLTGGVHLAMIGKDWDTQFPYDHIWSENGTEGPLLVASIFGRWYNKD